MCTNGLLLTKLSILELCETVDGTMTFLRNYAVIYEERADRLLGRTNKSTSQMNRTGVRSTLS